LSFLCILFLTFNYSFLWVFYTERSGLSPGMDNSQVIKYKNWDSVLGENDDLKKKLSGIDLVEDGESEEQYSERPIDGKL